MVTGYAVGLAEHMTRDGAVIWYGGGKLAADLTRPSCAPGGRRRRGRPRFGLWVSPAAARAVLRGAVTVAAEHAAGGAGFSPGCARPGVEVWLRFREADPDRSLVTPSGWRGMPGRTGRRRGTAAGLTLPRLRDRWRAGATGAPERSEAFRFTVSERDAIWAYAADAAERIH
jgi:hypothetical protein